MSAIRTRLLLGLLGGMLLVLLAGAAAMFVAVRDEVAELFDYQLEQTALAFAEQAQPAGRTMLRKDDDDPEMNLVVQVRDASGAVSFQSRPQPELPAVTSTGFSRVDVRGEPWRMFSAGAGGRLVQVAQPVAVRNEVARGIALHAVLWLLPLFPVAALLIWLTVGRGLRPLLSVAEDVRHRSHRDLRPLDTAGLPREVMPLAASLNDLMARLGRVIAAQKTFVADAAHELLTPITALQLHTQLLTRAGDESRRSEALADLRGALSRIIHLARQLLTLAQQDPDVQEMDTVAVDLAKLAQRVLSSQLPAAETKAISVESSLPATLEIVGEPDALATLLANLVDNAIKYTPAGGKLALSVASSSGRPSLIVEDSGPGIPPEDRRRVFDRFYRRAGSAAFGSGLGLAIVRDIAARHHAEVDLFTSARLGGLGVRVSF